MSPRFHSAPIESIAPGAECGRAGSKPFVTGFIDAGDTVLAVSLHRSPDEIEAQWRAFEDGAVCTLFQSYRWVSAWCRVAAEPFGERPVIVTATDASGRLAFILPLAIVRRFGVRTLTWLGQSQSAYNIGLYRPDTMDKLDVESMRQTLTVIRQAFPYLACVQLKGQPLEWEGHRNPIAALPFEPRQSCYFVPLSRDFAALCASRLRSDKRRDLRRQWRRITEDSSIAIAVARNTQERQAVMSTFFEQKLIWVSARGKRNLIGNAVVQNFFQELARDEAASESNVFALLEADGVASATMKGMVFKDRVYDLNGSFADTPLRRWSPGLLLEHDMMARACSRGSQYWDFGPGEGDHKMLWRANAIQTIDTSLVFRVFGHVPHTVERIEETLRATLRRHQPLHSGAKRIRSLLSRSARRLWRAANREPN